MYYNGDSGVGPGSYASTLSQVRASLSVFLPETGSQADNLGVQNFLTQATHDPTTGGPCPADADNCVLRFGGKDRPVASVVLISQGITFAVMTVFFTTIGSVADYANWNKWILIVATGK